MIQSRIQGIPCLIRVTSYATAIPSNRGKDPMQDPYDPGDFDYQVLDRKGYPADWLAMKITGADAERIYRDFMADRESARPEV